MLRSRGVPHRVLDANLEGLLSLIGVSQVPPGRGDAWTARAFRMRNSNLASIKRPGLYRNFDRYKKTVLDIMKVLQISAGYGLGTGLANYQDESLSPLRSSDLITAAERPERNLFFPYFGPRLSAIMKAKQPSYIGFSINYLSQALCAFAMIGFLRREFPEPRIVLGGGLVTSWLRGTRWQNAFSGLVDHLVAGPGEAGLSSILGIGEERSFHTPSYQDMPRSEYLAPGFILPYSASMGCYWNRCNFCPEKAEGNPYLSIPEERVISDLKALVEQTSPCLIHLLDSSVSPSLMGALAERAEGIPWYGFARIGRHLTDLDFCVGLKKSGCVMLKLGIESGDQEVLDEMNKGIDLETASMALRTLKKAGISAYVYLIFGTPSETVVEARKTLEFIVRHGDCVGFLNLAVFNMPVCIGAASGYSTRRFYEGDLSLYTDFEHPRGWDRKKVRMFLEHEFRRHPVISEILKKDPPVFTSNHAPFFVMTPDGAGGTRSCSL